MAWHGMAWQWKQHWPAPSHPTPSLPPSPSSHSPPARPPACRICLQAQIRDHDSAYGQINRALAAAVAARKPVYISIPCNFATVKHPAFAPEPVPFSLPAPISVPGLSTAAWGERWLAAPLCVLCRRCPTHTLSVLTAPAAPPPTQPNAVTRPPPPCAAAMLEAALSKTAAFMNKAVKPVLVCGAHMRSPRARAAMVALAEATGEREGLVGLGWQLGQQRHWRRLGWWQRRRLQTSAGPPATKLVTLITLEPPPISLQACRWL